MYDKIEIPGLGIARFSPNTDFSPASKIEIEYKNGGTREPIYTEEDEYPICPVCDSYLALWVEVGYKDGSPIANHAILTCNCSYGYDINSDREIKKANIHLL